MARHSVEDLRNVALVGHGAVGKTTIADQMLFKAGIVKRAGSVDEGSSHLDTDQDEKEWKHSIFSSICHFDRDGKHVNLIVTPGYPDLIGAAIGALRAVETAVVTISAAAGIEVNSRRMFNEAGKAGLGRMVLVNKCELDNINFDALLDSMRETFGSACIPLNVPVGLGANFTGVVSTLQVPDSIPEGAVTDPKAINQALMDAIVEADESLMERYLEGETLSPQEVSAGVTKAIAAGTLIPVFFASCRTGVGVQEFMDGITSYGLSPLQVRRTVLNGNGEEVEIKPAADAPLVAQVFKTRIDPFQGKQSFVRIFSGRLAHGTSIHGSSATRPTKVSHVMENQGSEHHDIDEAIAGDIVAIPKVDELHVGDTVTGETNGSRLPPIAFPRPMIGLAVEPKSRGDQQKISGALQKIAEEDQTFALTRDPQTKEMVMNGMSELHLQLVRARLQHRDKVEIITHQPKIPYRETCSNKAEGHYRHKKQSGGSGQFAEVHLRISPLPHGINPEEYFTRERFTGMREYHYDPHANFAFLDCVSGGSVPNQFIPAVEKGVRERMEKGVLAGYQVQDVVCELFFGKDHPVDSNETAFRTAASMAFKEVFNKAKPTLLEPIVTLEVTIPGSHLGDITSDLNGRRGRVEGMEGGPGSLQIIRAKVPLSEVMTYARSLSSMTGGQGSFTMEFSHYEMVPPNEQAKIVAAAQHHVEEEV